MLPEYRNEPFVDFSVKANADAMRTALSKVGDELGRTYPLLIGGEHIELADTFDSLNPAKPSQVVGSFAKATVEHANQAVEVAATTFESWRNVAAEERARYLFRAAAVMRRRKFEFMAWLVYEVSKSWAEADADVAEAIDFMEYYGRQAIKFGGPQPVVAYNGEENELRYVPLGVTVVIPPWNFALAIMVGMTTAAIAAGNTVVLKPASASPAIAAQFVRLLVEEAGLPDGVVNFVPGSGGAMGDALVDHAKTRLIAFTGSKEIGLRIFERSAKLQPGQIWLKRTILEMGGKDGIVVDETADLDAAADAIVASAFGFQGQKCSACSRAIIVDSVYSTVLKKVVDRTKKLTMGDPTDPKHHMGAVVDQKAFDKIREYIEIGKSEGRLMLGGETGDGSEGYFIPPTIIADIAPEARLSLEEIFGPVLAFIKANDWKHALEIANNTEYGLTGAVFSRSRERLEEARRDFHVGNLYFNRKCTGALVGVQPFGGFNMSGTDSKAGGPDYLLLFTQAKTITDRF
ncbi:MAG TPA: L-glutamate gamma-semialdehyde dehydrogenase [Herpetosiphon sp.]|uniref:L-glutamate gamma-semialdehyde dehydrogenase n=1 Tax=Herpetosiphon aurantiacus (strain ATCC 23779 / DSM 785 / 114-95) TaxID=316274 RepID=A9B212_HERA2|nr:L-glutamate gamma-semialdehyde dehydrogenase [Herpetosiphon sp.]ABX07362.1 putative delta-1-pyrroline-5-carboxylate dehydrogenase [Herpetosiphon aurantiacus DSM 785]HBW48437.1 L-glutamate gamma-semialdehyde dehydrogenase [Herpetosiphon sp.]